jgi:hypothetical protein
MLKEWLRPSSQRCTDISYNYIGELQKFAGSYNKTYHRTIGMPLNKVVENVLWPKKVSTESKSKTIRKPFRFKVGDKVRLT